MNKQGSSPNRSSVTASEPVEFQRYLLEDASRVVDSEFGFIFLADPGAHALLFYMGHNCEVDDIDFPILTGDTASGMGIGSREPQEFVGIREPSSPYKCKNFATAKGLDRYITLPLLRVKEDKGESDVEVLGILGLHPPLDFAVVEDHRAQLEQKAALLSCFIQLSLSLRQERYRQKLSDLTGSLLLLDREIPLDSVLESLRDAIEVEIVALLGHVEGELIVIGKSLPPFNLTLLRQGALESAGRSVPVLYDIDLEETVTGGHLLISAGVLSAEEADESTLVLADIVDSAGLKEFPELFQSHLAIDAVTSTLGRFLESRRYLQDLAEEQKRRLALTVGLAHEVLSPLTGIKSRLLALKSEAEREFPERDFESPPLVWFDDVIDALMDLEALSGSVMALNEERWAPKRCFLMGDIFLPVFHVVRSQARRRKIYIFFAEQEFRAKAPALELDDGLCRHVVYNVLKNAIKYANEGTVIRVKLRRKQGLVQMRVIDDGLAVPKGEEESIFEAFRKGSNSFVKDVHGAGLGLFIARRLMRLQDGDLFLERRNEPTVFTIGFPIPSAVQQEE